MIYFKITDKESEAFQRHTLLKKQYRESNDKVGELSKEYNLSESYYRRGNSVVGWPAPDNKEELPKGFRIKGKMMVPDRRTKIGKELSQKMNAISFPDASSYMKNIFHETASAHTSPRRMTTGCTCKNLDEGVIISVHPKVYLAAQEKNKFNVPEGLEEITGSEYNRLLEKHKELVAAKKN